ncbi:MAG: hypothetical protein QOD35_1370 [Nocardioidaceae bacterium]|jgi:hypothetical protein|nr:hypothetical protein [Nocardioidaceae bacterium]
MAWVAPEVVRHDEPFVGGEREMLRGFLQYGRVSLLLPCAGLSSEQLVLRSAPPSSLSLLGLVRHACDVERTWLRRRMGRQAVPPLYATPDAPDAAFDGTQARRAEADFAQLLAEWGAADEAVAPIDLDATCVSPTWGEKPELGVPAPDPGSTPVTAVRRISSASASTVAPLLTD